MQGHRRKQRISRPLLTGGIAASALAFGVVLTVSPGVHAQSSDDGASAVTKWTPPSGDPRDFEGVWLPESGPPPSGNAGPAGGGASVAKAAPAPGVQTGRPADAPVEIGGLDVKPNGGAPGRSGPTPAASGTNLQCTPIDRVTGAGGGMANLWFQDSHEIVLISEEDQDIARKIYLDLKMHPKHLVPQPNGNSIGHWEGNTLVVDTVGYATPRGRLRDQHRIERFSKLGNHLIDDVTTISGGQIQHQTNREMWRSDLHVFENVCEEGYDRYQVVNGVVTNANVSPSEEK